MLIPIWVAPNNNEAHGENEFYSFGHLYSGIGPRQVKVTKEEMKAAPLRSVAENLGIDEEDMAEIGLTPETMTYSYREEGEDWCIVFVEAKLAPM